MFLTTIVAVHVKKNEIIRIWVLWIIFQDRVIMVHHSSHILKEHSITSSEIFRGTITLPVNSDIAGRESQHFLFKY